MMPDPARPAEPTISYVIVAYRSGPELERTLPALAGELAPGDEVIIVDNFPAESPRDVVSRHLPEARLIEIENNSGFTGGVNRGVSEASCDLVLLLNPDAMPEAGFGESIRRPFSERPEWSAWMALVACRIDGGKVVNTWGNPIHFTGISWAGGHGESLDGAGGPHEISNASGAALVVRRDVWNRIGGFPQEFFLYCEDTDLSVRIRSAGHAIGIQTDAVVDHDYEFHANEGKWFWLERNRVAMVIRNFPGPLLVLLFPALLATEIALLAVSAKQGWFGAKARSYRDLIRWFPRLRRERREIQAARTISPKEFADLLTPDLDSPMFPSVVRKGLIKSLLRAYWSFVKALLP